MKLERILVPVDFSEMSREALVAADRLAMQVDGRLTVLYVHEAVQVQAVDYTHADVEDLSASPALAEQLRAWAAQCRTPPERVSTRIVDGSAVNAIIDASRAHGRTGVSRFMLGSVAERVVRGAECSVFILKPPAS
jgi:nucleotide-binding universal stress UspA family protein